MKTIANRYRGLDGIIRAAQDATIAAAMISLILISTLFLKFNRCKLFN
jgi:hypothetical protein